MTAKSLCHFADASSSSVSTLSPAPISFPQKRRQKTIDDLYRDCWGDLTAWLYRRYGVGPPEPEEIAQAAFAKMMEVPDLSLIRNLRAYLFTTAVRCAIDGFRGQGRAQRFIDNELKAHQEEVGEITPERVFIARQEFSALANRVKALDPKQREVVLRSRIMGQTYDEISQETGWSKSAIGRYLQSALVELAASNPATALNDTKE